MNVNTLDIVRDVNINTAEDFEEYFLNHDNSKNLTLMSKIPDKCKEELCILGVDEAGRGPVLGPMVYGVCYCVLSNEKVLETAGCADSKSLTELKREKIFGSLCDEITSIGWAIEANSPNTICNKMLKRQKYSLNLIAQDSTVNLIQQVLDSGVQVDHVYVDTVGMPDKYEEKLKAIFPQLKITVEKKADATYPIVSAASICAKVSRDRALRAWFFQEGLSATHEDFGSGYPTDPVTKTFLRNNIDVVFGFPQLVRFSWSTAAKILKEHAAAVEWEEEEEEEEEGASKSIRITQFFQSFAHGSATTQKKLHPFFTTRNLQRCESL